MRKPSILEPLEGITSKPWHILSGVAWDCLEASSLEQRLFIRDFGQNLVQGRIFFNSHHFKIEISCWCVRSDFTASFTIHRSPLYMCPAGCKCQELRNPVCYHPSLGFAPLVSHLQASEGPCFSVLTRWGLVADWTPSNQDFLEPPRLLPTLLKYYRDKGHLPDYGNNFL